MDETAKIELEHRVKLYQFYLGCYIKGIAFFLAITAALLKFALDSTKHSRIFSWAGILRRYDSYPSCLWVYSRAAYCLRFSTSRRGNKDTCD